MDAEPGLLLKNLRSKFVKLGGTPLISYRPIGSMDDVYIYIYTYRTQMGPLVLIGKGLVFFLGGG